MGSRKLHSAFLALALISVLLGSGCIGQDLAGDPVSTPTPDEGASRGPMGGIAPGDEPASNPPPSGESLRIAELDLPGMACPYCALNAENAFKGMEGVVDARVDIRTKKGTVVYDSGIVSKEELIQNAWIRAYDGKILSDRPYDPAEVASRGG
jgi:copper chaperone CopZ